jgi:rhodanese-related sulfurtransferase
MNTISVEDLKKKMDQRESFHLIDVREPDEHVQFNIGGTLIPLGKIQSMQIEELEDFKEEEIILYCRSGNRSGQACLILDMLGFKNTNNLAGGMLAWQDRILPLIIEFFPAKLKQPPGLPFLSFTIS